ncbi:sensor histidine kinase [Rhizobium sp. VS19-DR104.2]|uniref:sensor histidine kinase n=1 Tax=unclassified Rhizobium TaxID=2613769 RepID=UPI001ADB634E|nr:MULTISPECIES: sensor histidine kinase [unclassified Rhizobium]MBO9101087.1 sensor histidine kinase [Rhizobium sp. L58/93]MBO9186675.1 sensor histidine kinase [Rhizobium sp. E27B/91]MBZ5762415.1 sensor histidine kinase [Rhizobium sp. VS19-DR96]MBZ5768434.1 sensor histidine kinase [Rhizobium sp. VS19-DR129.2]MBZ5776088.1 sensor histidine kinase [Rhizobium sp. VS19-DRK62.2]
MNDVPTDSELDWVLVLAPFRKDADYIAAFLREQMIEVMPAKAGDELGEHLARSPGIIVITHEALNPEAVARIAEHLAEQPDWSEVPIIVLLERSAPIARIRVQLQNSWPGARLLFHTRPIAPLELVNGIQSNLLVRLRQRQVRDSIERERELRLELNHRVKNILASVGSIFQMTRRGATTVEDLASNYTGRLQALSDVHTAVFEAGGEEVALSAVVDLTVSPYNKDGVSRIKVSGPGIVVSRNAGTTIALCLHELITNAIKYGALSRPEGHVEIVWTFAKDDSSDFSVNWTEVGGPMVREPTRQGYGTRYVRSALGSLFGTAPEIVFAPGGFRCSVSGPVKRISSGTTGS